MYRFQPLQSKLSRQFFIAMLVLVCAIFTIIYFYTVPLIKQKVFEIERNASRLALNNVFEIANRMSANVEEYQTQALKAHQQQLKVAVSLTEAYLHTQFREAKQLNISNAQARLKAFEAIREFTYNNNDYIWIADYNGVLLSHPDPRFHGKPSVNMIDTDGQPILSKVIQQAQQNGEGFLQYKWNRPSQSLPQEKVSYFKNYPEWGLIIGSGVYLDDLAHEVENRKKRALTELRNALQQIKVAKTGYLFIFDSNSNILIHPNSNIDGKRIEKLENPVTHNPITDDLKEVADTGQELHYKWDKPDDPNNYIYEKLSLVRYMSSFDWYICSSVYLDELRSSSETLSNRIVWLASVTILGALLLAAFFAHKVMYPITQLAQTALKVSSGDLSAKSGIQRDDELGILASSFDSMVERLKDNINTLDTKVKRRTAQLEATQERQRLILDALPAQVAYFTPELHYLFVNQAYAQQFQHTIPEVIGKHLREILGGTMYDAIYPELQTAIEGQETTYIYAFKHGERDIITKRILIPEKGSDGQVKGILNLSLDITAEKQAERQLTEAQRMSAVGQLAGGLAHDFNNLLSIILGNLLLAQDQYQHTQGLENLLAPAIRATRRGADITHRLLAFSRRQPLQPVAVNIDQLMRETLELLRGSLPSNIQLDYQADDTSGIANLDPSHMENALVNLALNARDAMPNGGLLCFHTYRQSVNEPLNFDELVPAGDYIAISVSDTGSGFSEEALRWAYEPFYTTKAGTNNSGLGLSMVYGFVKQSQGYIHIDSQSGKGACITLLLPLSHSAVYSKDARQTSTLGKDLVGKLLLLVEDNPDVRDVVREQLIQLGLHIVEAEDGEEALQLIASLPSLDGMVSDIMLPGGLDGRYLAQQLYHNNPQSIILLISGYAHDSGLQAADGVYFPVLRKPFDQERLSDALRRAAQHKGGEN